MSDKPAIWARELKDIYNALMDTGFTQEEAFELLKTITPVLFDATLRR